MRALALSHRPKAIVCGSIAYPRHLDYAFFREVADEVGAYLIADAAHPIGLVAGGAAPSPVPYADIVFAAAHKVLRGPRGGMILCGSELAERVDRAVFPFTQGGAQMHTIAAKAVAFGEAATPAFAAYTHQVVANARVLAAGLSDAFVTSPVNPQALTHPVKLGVKGNGDVHRGYPLMGMTGRPGVAHFATVTHWTPTGARLNGIRFLQIHPDTARRLGIDDRDEVVVESPRRQGHRHGYWPGIRKDAGVHPEHLGPAQHLAEDLGGTRYEAVNALVDDRYYDNLSGRQACGCFACRVTKTPS
ncbi:Serine hydroxymethyltransferase [Streptomyces griseomycini]